MHCSSTGIEYPIRQGMTAYTEKIICKFELPEVTSIHIIHIAPNGNFLLNQFKTPADVMETRPRSETNNV